MKPLQLKEDLLRQEFHLIVQDITQNGFYPDRQTVATEFKRLFKTKGCFDGENFNKNMIASNTWAYHPHAFGVVVSGTSILDKLKEPANLEQIAGKTVNYCMKYEGERMPRNRVIQSLKAYNGHHVSNFRPVAARDLYLTLVGVNAKVLDMCAGWGGRLLGANAAHCKSYLGVDASRQTVRGLNLMIRELGLKGSKVIHSAFEDVCLGNKQFDIAFTSPPYFNAECYSDDQEQSYLRYRDYQSWVEGFLRPMLVKAGNHVKPSGYVCINIADIKKFRLCDDTLRIASEAGLTHVKTYNYVLSSIAGKGAKVEPIFVFKKQTIKRKLF